MSEGISSLSIKKIAGSNYNAFLDSELHMSDEKQELSESALGSDLDITGEITEALNKLRTVKEFNTKEQDGSRNTEFGVSLPVRESSMGITMELKLTERFPITGSTARRRGGSLCLMMTVTA